MVGDAVVVLLMPLPGSGYHPGDLTDGEMPLTVLLLLVLAAGVMLLVLPFMVAVLILFQSLNPMSNDVWERPHHRANPFRLGNPLLFLHFAGWLAIASGAGMALRSVTGELGFLFHGLYVIVSGGSILVGVRLGMRWCRKKMAPPRLLRTQPSEADVIGDEAQAVSVPPVQDKGAEARSRFFGFVLNLFRWASLIWLVAGLAVGVYLQRRLNRSKLVTATVVGFETSTHEGTRMYTPVFRLTNSSGRPVRSMASYSSSHPSLEVGDEVEVYYDPNDPGTVLRPGIMTWILPIAFCSAGIGGFAILSTIIYFRRRQANTHQADDAVV
jgi:hypothetical protein